MKKILTTLIVLLCFTLVEPMATWANDVGETVESAQEATNEYPKTKYCNGSNVNIRKEPNLDSEVIDQSLINTSFEVLDENNGWSKIYGENDDYCGYGYIKSEYLSDEEVTYTGEDLYIMAHVIAGEAQPYDDMEQRYVASVVLNRARHSEFPNTIKDVIFQKGQYACVSDGNYYREPTDRNWANAKWVLENGSVLPDNVIWQSGGKQGKGVYLHTKHHYYCY